MTVSILVRLTGTVPVDTAPDSMLALGTHQSALLHDRAMQADFDIRGKGPTIVSVAVTRLAATRSLLRLRRVILKASRCS